MEGEPIPPENSVCNAKVRRTSHIQMLPHPHQPRTAHQVWVREKDKTTTAVAVTPQHTDSLLSSWFSHCVRHSFSMHQNSFSIIYLLSLMA